jgi:hypothetical protein
MELRRMPRQYQLIHDLSEYIFNKSEVKCGVFLSKTPYLSALIACHGAKKNIQYPYLPGTCLLLSLGDQNVYKHIVIERFEEFKGQLFYYFKLRKKYSIQHKKITSIDNDIGLEAKPMSYVEKEGILFPHKLEEEWLGKHDIPKSEIEQISNDSFPAIIGQKNLVEYWKNKELHLYANPDYTMADILNIAKKDNKFDRLNILSTRSEKRKRHINQIWVNSVPSNLDSGKYLIILSPAHSLFEEKTSEINQIYSDGKLSQISNSELPHDLLELGISNRSLFIATLLKEYVE